MPEPSVRFHAARRRGLTPFVGREEDSYLIRQAARRAAQGRGRAVALVGEPGVGKSRLVHEFITAIAEGEWQVLETGVGSFGKSTAYGPLLEVLRSIFGFSNSEPRSRFAEQLRAQILALGEDLPADAIDNQHFSVNWPKKIDGLTRDGRIRTHKDDVKFGQGPKNRLPRFQTPDDGPPILPDR